MTLRKINRSNGAAHLRTAIRAAAIGAALATVNVAFGQADWTQQHPVHVPPARSGHSMAQFGNQVLLFGGLNSAGTALGDTWLWDGTDWTEITSLGEFNTGARPSPRFGASMAYNPDTRVLLLFGGEDQAGNLLGDTWVFRFVQQSTKVRYFSWDQLSISNGPTARRFASMDYDATPKTIVMTSGLGQNGAARAPLQDTWSFSGGQTGFLGSLSAGSWTQIADPNPPSPARSESAMAKCGPSSSAGPESLLLFGGLNSIGADQADAWVFQPSASQMLWSGPAPVMAIQPLGRFDHQMAYYPQSGKTVLYGGVTRNDFCSAQTVARNFSDTWNGSCPTASWASASPAHNPGFRQSHAMATGPNGFTVVLFGGLKATGSCAIATQADASNETWTWGRKAACSSADGSEVPVGSQVLCQFASGEGTSFSGWTANGFAPPFRDELTTTFHTEAPGLASITAQWLDQTGPHSQTFTYTITHPH